jgi:hypothetical protein
MYKDPCSIKHLFLKFTMLNCNQVCVCVCVCVCVTASHFHPCLIFYLWVREFCKLSKSRGHIHNTFFFVTYKLAWQAEVLHYSRMEMLVGDKHSSFKDPFVSYAKMKCCEYAPRGLYYKTFMTVIYFTASQEYIWPCQSFWP